jgi:ABC-type multidrug transport system fused ATPase/permease subunit
MTLSAMRQSQTTLLAADRTKAKSAIAAVLAILDRKSRIDPSDTSGQTMDAVRGDIEFQHVIFCYPSRPEVMVFRDLSLSIHAGQVLLCFLFDKVCPRIKISLLTVHYFLDVKIFYYLTLFNKMMTG